MLLLLVLDELGGDSVHVGVAFLGQSLAGGLRDAFLIFVFHLADEVLLLKLLQAIADDLACGSAVVLSLNASSRFASVVVLERVHADLAPHIKLVGKRRGARVEPVRLVRRKLLVTSSLDIGGPLLR